MKKLMSLFALSTLTLFGCAMNSNHHAAGIRVESASQNVFQDNKELGKELSIENIVVDKVGENVRGVVQLTNSSDRDMHLVYRFTWYDENEVIIGKPRGWHQAIVHSREPMSLLDMAGVPHAAHFKLFIRETK